MLSRQKIRFGISAAIVSGCLASTVSQVHAQTGEGAALGGVAGAVIGGIVGHQNNETPEGALIGGAIGAVTGGVIGHARAQNQQRQQQVYGAPVVAQPGMPYYATNGRKPVSIADVITLTRSGVSESVIINQIHTSGVVNRPEVNEVVLMHQQGVSNIVIESMQQANIGAPTAPVAAYAPVPTYTAPVATYAAPTPVIIEQSPVIVTRPVYSTPPIYLNFNRGYYPHHHHHRF